MTAVHLGLAELGRQDAPREWFVIASASEAIQLGNHDWMASSYLDCFVAFDPRNDGAVTSGYEIVPAHSRVSGNPAQAIFPGLLRFGSQ